MRPVRGRHSRSSIPIFVGGPNEAQPGVWIEFHDLNVQLFYAGCPLWHDPALLINCLWTTTWIWVFWGWLRIALVSSSSSRMQSSRRFLSTPWHANPLHPLPYLRRPSSLATSVQPSFTQWHRGSYPLSGGIRCNLMRVSDTQNYPSPPLTELVTDCGANVPLGVCLYGYCALVGVCVAVCI